MIIEITKKVTFEGQDDIEILDAMKKLIGNMLQHSIEEILSHEEYKTLMRFFRDYIK